MLTAFTMLEVDRPFDLSTINKGFGDNTQLVYRPWALSFILPVVRFHPNVKDVGTFRCLEYTANRLQWVNSHELGKPGVAGLKLT
jgi:hypothetical protein